MKLWVRLRELRALGFHFRRQVPIGRAVVDFACLRHWLVVEVDGGQHSFDGNAAKDTARDARLNDLGFRVLRFWNSEVDRNLDGVVETILAALDERTAPTPSPRIASEARTLPSGEG